MNKFRLFRDLSILALGAAGLFGVFTLVNMFGGATDSNSRSEISNARKVADLSVKRGNWTNALASNKKLAEQDPYNGHAWYYQAAAQFKIATKANSKLQSLDDEATDQQRNEARTQFENDAEETCRLFEKCFEFARYRNRARANIAYMQMLLGNEDEALNFLELAVKDGFYNRQHNLDAYDSLREHPRFISIARQEYRNRRNSLGNKQPQAYFAK